MKTQTPIRLWCFCYEYTTDLLSLSAVGCFDLQGQIPYEFVMNCTPDISEYSSFTWFQWCWYFDETTCTKKLCYLLGPAHHSGQSFCSYIIIANGNFAARSSVIPIPTDELIGDDLLKQTRVLHREQKSPLFYKIW